MATTLTYYDIVGGRRNVPAVELSSEQEALIMNPRPVMMNAELDRRRQQLRQLEAEFVSIQHETNVEWHRSGRTPSNDRTPALLQARKDNRESFWRVQEEVARLEREMAQTISVMERLEQVTLT